MSKTDDLRAMREAKYDRIAAARSERPATAKPARVTVSEPSTEHAAALESDTTVDTPAAAPVKKSPARKAPAEKPSAITPPIPSEAAAAFNDPQCGHRSMNGRACTRESGHAEKSHRYS